MRRLADAMAQWLVDRGFRHAFGIIGGGNVVLWDAIAALGRTELVSCHHEQAAAMAAAYYARTMGGVGLALVTTGAGSANAITGVMAAHMDGVPLMVISGNENSGYMYKPTRVWGVQGYDSARVARNFTKYGDRLEVPAHWKIVFDKQFERCLAAPQGPVWIDIPKDIQAKEIPNAIQKQSAALMDVREQA